MIKIYVASSWRNEDQPKLVEMLRVRGYEVYDFKNPPNRTGFGWSQTGVDAKANVHEFLKALDTPIALAGYNSDYMAIRGCDVCILLLPSGRSAHLELGLAAGLGKGTIVCIPEEKFDEPELMYLMADAICTSLEDAVNAVEVVKG